MLLTQGSSSPRNPLIGCSLLLWYQTSDAEVPCATSVLVQQEVLAVRDSQRVIVWVSVYRDESDSHTVSDAQSVCVCVNESKKNPIERTYGMLINVILIEMLCYSCHLKWTHLIKTQESKFTKRKSEWPLKTSVFIQLHLIPHSKQGQKHIFA